ncbi:MAG: hypothetical protein OXQ93_13480 [Gemmatimonadota bacterium]|nr:hypothetical protein [Gemmatimonadota bacterium]
MATPFVKFDKRPLPTVADEYSTVNRLNARDGARKLSRPFATPADRPYEPTIVAEKLHAGTTATEHEVTEIAPYDLWEIAFDDSFAFRVAQPNYFGQAELAAITD